MKSKDGDYDVWTYFPKGKTVCTVYMKDDIVVMPVQCGGSSGNGRGFFGNLMKAYNPKAIDCVTQRTPAGDITRCD